jgi:hypothetical protein
VPNFRLQLISVVLFADHRPAIHSAPRRGSRYADAASDRVLRGRGLFEGNFSHDTAVCKLRMGLSEWCCGNTAVFLSLANLSVTAIWLLGVLLGIQLISEGLALGYLAWRVRQSDVTNRSDPSLPRTKKRPHAQVNGDVPLVSALSVIDPPGDRDQW